MDASENGVAGARSVGNVSAAGAGTVTPSWRIRTWASETSGTRMTNSASQPMTRWATIGNRMEEWVTSGHGGHRRTATPSGTSSGPRTATVRSVTRASPITAASRTRATSATATGRTG